MGTRPRIRLGHLHTGRENAAQVIKVSTSIVFHGLYLYIIFLYGMNGSSHARACAGRGCVAAPATATA